MPLASEIKKKAPRSFFAYDAEDKTEFYLIIEAHHSVTTVLLPEDY